MIPTLYTRRLKLRAPTMADLDAMVAFYAQSTVEVGGYARRDASGAKAKLENMIAGWDRHDHGLWLLENAEREVIGGAGLALPDGFPHHELTWFLFEEHQGKGFATEASKAVIAWGYDAAGLNPVMTYMRDDNAPARALAARLGGKVVRRETFPDGVTRDVFALPHPGLHARQAQVRLETDRLILRQPAAGDVDAWVPFCLSERSKYVRAEDMDEPKAWRAFSAIVGHWTLRGYGSLIYALKETPDQPLGLVGPWKPQGFPEVEIAWSIWNEADQGKGYVYEAAVASRDWAFGDVGLSGAVSYIDARNTRSIRLAERLGAAPDWSAETPRGEQCVVFRHPGPEALS